MNIVFITGKYFKKGLVRIKTRAANSMIAKQPNNTYPTPPSMG